MDGDTCRRCWKNRFLTLVSPPNEEESMWINQDAWFSLGDFDSDHNTEYQLHKPENGVYVFVISGQANIAGETLYKRDAIGITGSNAIAIHVEQPSQILIIEVPMK